jgi:hypothetical protein
MLMSLTLGCPTKRAVKITYSILAVRDSTPETPNMTILITKFVDVNLKRYLALSF